MSEKPAYEELEQSVKALEEESQKRKRAEAALKESEDRYRAILEDIEDGFSEVDLAGDVTFSNNAARKIFGYPENELMGLNWKNLVPEESIQRVYQAFNRVYRTGVPDKGFAYEIIRKDGTKRFIEASVHLIKNSEGIPIGFRNIIRDITDRKRAEEELARHRGHLLAIFRSVKDAIITVDNGMRVMEANKSSEEICGLDQKDNIGKAFKDCLNHCDKSCYEVLLNALKRKATVKEYRIECSRQDRDQQTVVVTGSPLLDREGDYMGAILVIRDITRLSDLEKELVEKHQFQNIIGKSRKMQDIYRLLEDLSDLETTVLVTGKSGTGKELIAKALHYSGNRAYKPLIKVNCSALAENLLESELFGHVKGAFTGAIRDKQGRFQAANGGTILMDEIGDISPRIQLKLLRVLEEKEFERVGESLPIKVDVRVISNTNRDLRERVRVGEFREDLYYRLKVVEIALPSLRERLDDIPLLVDHFCHIFNEKFEKNIQGVSDGVFKLFMNYSWPGNIRELKHTIERGFILCRGETITTEYIPSEIREYSGIKRHLPEKRSVEGPREILEALKKAGWNKTKAARLLGINRRTIYRKISKYQIEIPSEFS